MSHMVSVDDITTKLPDEGCTNKHRLPTTTKSVKLNDHQIACMVNELTEIAKDYGKFQSIRARISKVVIKHLKP